MTDPGEPQSVLSGSYFPKRQLARTATATNSVIHPAPRSANAVPTTINAQAGASCGYRSPRPFGHTDLARLLTSLPVVMFAT